MEKAALFPSKKVISLIFRIDANGIGVLSLS
jgi:hypothetical protein